MTTTAENMAQHGLGAHSHGSGVPAAVRVAATRADREDPSEVPAGREESWRFTPMKRLRGLVPGTAATGEATVEVDAPADARVEVVARDDDRIGVAGRPVDYVTQFAWNSFDKATLVTVPREVRLPGPATVTVTGPGEGRTAYGHLQVRAEPNASAVVVVDYRGGGLFADNVEFLVEDGARLTVVSIQDWADDAVHVSAQHAALGRDATLRHTMVTLGGDVVRLSPTVTYTAPGGDAELLGLYFADAGQHLEHRTFVDHAVPNCKSNVAYKGALQGDGAHTVWIGDVLIRAAESIVALVTAAGDMAGSSRAHIQESVTHCVNDIITRLPDYYNVLNSGHPAALNHVLADVATIVDGWA